MQGQRAADATVWADCVRMFLIRFVPCTGFAHVMLALEHERAGWTDADAVAAIDACGFGERNIILGRNVRVESTAGDGDGKGVLRVAAAGFHTFITKDAL